MSISMDSSNATTSSSQGNSVVSSNIKQSSNSKTVIIIVALLALLFVCCGCSFGGYLLFATADETSTSTSSDDDSEEEDTDNDEDATPTDEESGGDEDYGFPSEISIYPGTTEVFSYDGSDDFGPFHTYSGLVTGGEAVEIYNYYLEELGDNGWTITDEQMVWGNTIYAKKGTTSIIVSVEGDDPTVTTITTTYVN